MNELTKLVLAHLHEIQVRIHKIVELAPDVVAVQYDFMEDDDFVLYFGSDNGKVEKCTANLWVSDVFYGRTFPRPNASWLAIASARLTAGGVLIQWYSVPKEVEIPSQIRAY